MFTNRFFKLTKEATWKTWRITFILLLLIVVSLLIPKALSQSGTASTGPPSSTVAMVHKSLQRPRVVYIDDYVHGQAIITEVGTHLRYTFRHAVPRPYKTHLSSYTEGMFAIISDGSKGKPVEVKLLVGSEGGRGRIDIQCENEAGTISCWSQIFPGGVQYIPGLFLK